MMSRLFKCFVVLAIATTALFAQQQPHRPDQHKPDHMQHRFDDPAKFARSFDDPARDAWQMPHRVVEALAPAPDARVADIGAGTGYFAMRLAAAVPAGTVYAVDVEPAMLEHIRQRAKAAKLENIVTVQAASASPNLPAPVDVVLVVNTYHHLPQRTSYFRALQKQLKPAAAVAIVDFRKDAPEGPPPEFRFEADEIVREMESAGFRLDAHHDFLPRQHFLIFRAQAGR
jgi:FkbM family methyltransferase